MKYESLNIEFNMLVLINLCCSYLKFVSIDWFRLLVLSDTIKLLQEAQVMEIETLIHAAE